MVRTSKAFALTWYRGLTWCFLRLGSPRTHRALESCRHAGEGLPCSSVTSSGTSGAANGRAGEQYQVKARYQLRANALLTAASRSMSRPYMLNTQSEDKNTVFYVIFSLLCEY